MSHLDTMRLMQRAFRRAGVLLHHSQGYTPHAYVSVILPLSVGVESVCEIMEYEIDDDFVITPQEMNAVLPEGVRVLEIYESARKSKELTHLIAELDLEYDNVLGDPEEISQLLAMPSLLVEKKTKRGIEETDIRPMLTEYSVTSTEKHVKIICTVCAQNPSLNPMLLVSAIERYLPHLKPSFAKCRRLEVLDAQGQRFR